MSKQKIVGIALLFFLFVFGFMPFVVNLLFKSDWNIEFLRAEWGAEDALSYCGSIISAISAVIGVFLTIQYSQKNYKEDVRNRVLPFISFDTLTVESKFNVFKSLERECKKEDELRDEDEQINYKEYINKSYYCIIEDNQITYQRELNKEDKDLIKRGYKIEKTNTGKRILHVDYLYMPIQIMNVGNGIAVNFRYGLNRAETKTDERRFLPSMLLEKDSVCFAYFFAKNYTKDICGEYILSFVYEDMYKNKYIQNFRFDIIYDEKTENTGFEIHMDHTQEMLK